jgi:hypothetical protein
VFLTHTSWSLVFWVDRVITVFELNYYNIYSIYSSLLSWTHHLTNTFSLIIALALGRHHTLCWDPVSSLLVVPCIHQGTEHQMSHRNRGSSHFPLEHLQEGIAHHLTMHLIQKQLAHPHHGPPIITTGVETLLKWYFMVIHFILFQWRVKFDHISFLYRQLVFPFCISSYYVQAYSSSNFSYFHITLSLWLCHSCDG